MTPPLFGLLESKGMTQRTPDGKDSRRAVPELLSAGLGVHIPSA
jgi:hypothetical protein